MATLYIRDFPEELWKALKIRAVEEGKTLKLVCIEILGKEIKKKGGKSG